MVYFTRGHWRALLSRYKSWTQDLKAHIGAKGFKAFEEIAQMLIFLQFLSRDARNLYHPCWWTGLLHPEMWNVFMHVSIEVMKKQHLQHTCWGFLHQFSPFLWSVSSWPINPIFNIIGIWTWAINTLHKTALNAMTKKNHFIHTHCAFTLCMWTFDLSDGAHGYMGQSDEADEYKVTINDWYQSVAYNINQFNQTYCFRKIL